MSDAFIREVEEDIRHKQISDLWKRYGKLVIGMAVGIVLVVAGRSLYTYVVEGKYNKQAEAYTDALKLSGDNLSSALDPIIASGVDGYEIVASFKKAELALEKDDKAGAVAVLDNFIKNVEVAEVYKDMANIQAAIIELDTAPTDAIRSRLSLILNGETSFKYLAAEIIALSELNSGDNEAAKTSLQALIANADVPASVKNRAEQYLSVIE
ncbi:MAG: tetratricopeptide repeat protein [Emcibacteraceae bacterium]